VVHADAAFWQTSHFIAKLRFNVKSRIGAMIADFSGVLNLGALVFLRELARPVNLKAARAPTRSPWL